MCDPVTAMVTFAAVTGGLGVYQSYEASRQQNAVFKQNQKNSLKSLVDSYDSQAVSANQRREAAGQSATQNAIEAAKARATATAAATDSNIGGLSVDALMNELTRQESTNYGNIATNERFAEEQRQREAQGLTNQTQSRINSVAPGSFNPIIGLLQIGSEAGGAYYTSKASRSKT